MPTRILLAFLLLLTAGPAAAQEYESGAYPPFALRIDADAVEDEASLSLGDLTRGLHVMKRVDQSVEPEPVVLFSVLVEDGEVVAHTQTPFVAAPLEGDAPEGTFMGRVSGARAIPLEYFQQREEVGRQFGDAWMRSEVVERLGPDVLLTPAEDFVVGTAHVSNAESVRSLVGETLEQVGFGGGEPGDTFLVFFVAPPDKGEVQTEVVTLLRKRPGRSK